MRKVYLVVAFVFLAQLIAAVICGPHSCEWGNTWYFAIGLCSMLFVIIAMLMQKHWDVVRRLGFAALFSFLSLLVWVTGFMTGEFSILCKLF